MFKKQKSVSGVLTLNFIPKKGGLLVSDSFIAWVDYKTTRYDCPSHKRALFFTL
ncbi:hypothetical protein [Helicobacter pylori]|uniref:hypothetical protein n=1 Tax=Helicobacter pylori TaxID=210 RepID=UPI00165B78A6|nr:hypothetical protein [Helicobacter pylori]